MKNKMEYKGYQSKIEFSEADNCFFGEIDGITDCVTFEGDHVAELRKAFAEAVDYYLDICKDSGKIPQVPYKGSFNVRITPDLHKKAVQLAASKNTTLNKFIQSAIAEKIERDTESCSKISEDISK